MANHAQLTARDISGPYMQLLTNLQGDDGPEVLEALKRFNRKENPWPLTSFFHRNRNGHWVIEMTGLDLTGAQEIERLEAQGILVDYSAKQMLLSNASDSYDGNHRLEKGGIYRIALIPWYKVKQMRSIGAYAELFGYEKPLAGLVPRILEAVTGSQLRQMGYRTISILHAPIQDSSQDFVDSMFFLFSSDDGEEKQLELCARPDWPGGGDEGAGYAFLDPGLI